MRTLPPKLAAGLAATALIPFASAQDVAFSISWQGPTISLPASFGGGPITEGDILAVAPTGVPALGLSPVPGIARSHGFGGLGLMPGCVGHPGGTPCIVEVDALSMGQDPLLSPNGVSTSGLAWSTDEYARSFPGVPVPPNLRTEAGVGDSSGDVWTNTVPLPGLPMPPFAGGPDHRGLFDGDGLPSGTGFAYPGFGLIEPNPPTFGAMDLGDDLDALVFKHEDSIPAYFSLDADFPDPLTGIPNSGSALAHGFSPADVLISPPGVGGPAVFAPSFLLGLDLTGARDDVDALYLAENGSGAFEPSQQPFDWFSGSTDMLLFSVRRGSPVIGSPDSIFGIPISEGDILTTPLPTFLGGVSPFPGIFIAAENLGLATLRSGTAMGNVDDDLNAVAGKQGAFFDCNSNGIEDAVDIAMGAPDVNMNGIPDSCESTLVSQFCFCVAGAPCGNVDPTAGCRNSTGVGALLTPSGTTSVGADNLVLTATSLPPFAFGIPFMGPVTVGPAFFGDGLRCVGGTLRRFPVIAANGAGTAIIGPGLVAQSIAFFPPAGQITVGSTWHFQHWYRDTTGPCGNGYSITNAVSATFIP